MIISYLEDVISKKETNWNQYRVLVIIRNCIMYTDEWNENEIRIMTEAMRCLDFDINEAYSEFDNKYYILEHLIDEHSFLWLSNENKLDFIDKHKQSWASDSIKYLRILLNDEWFIDHTFDWNSSDEYRQQIESYNDIISDSLNNDNWIQLLKFLLRSDDWLEISNEDIKNCILKDFPQSLFEFFDIELDGEKISVNDFLKSYNLNLTKKSFLNIWNSLDSDKEKYEFYNWAKQMLKTIVWDDWKSGELMMLNRIWLDFNPFRKDLVELWDFIYELEGTPEFLIIWIKLENNLNTEEEVKCYMENVKTEVKNITDWDSNRGDFVKSVELINKALHLSWDAWPSEIDMLQRKWEEWNIWFDFALTVKWINDRYVILWVFAWVVHYENKDTVFWNMVWIHPIVKDYWMWRRLYQGMAEKLLAKRKKYLLWCVPIIKNLHFNLNTIWWVFICLRSRNFEDIRWSGLDSWNRVDRFLAWRDLSKLAEWVSREKIEIDWPVFDLEIEINDIDIDDKINYEAILNYKTWNCWNKDIDSFKRRLDEKIAAIKPWGLIRISKNEELNWTKKYQLWIKILLDFIYRKDIVIDWVKEEKLSSIFKFNDYKNIDNLSIEMINFAKSIPFDSR